MSVGAGAETARRDHRGHILRVTEGRPMVTLKLARTADGFAAGDEHDARLAITGEAANLRVQVMRSLHDAIMVGIGTAREDDPLLTVRLPGVDARPLRVILDSRLGLPPRSRLVRDGARIPDAGDRDARGGRGARSGARRQRRRSRARRSPILRGRVDLAEALRLLARRGVTRVFSEGGPRVGARLIALGLADEVVLLTALQAAWAGRACPRSTRRPTPS